MFLESFLYCSTFIRENKRFDENIICFGKNVFVLMKIKGV